MAAIINNRPDLAFSFGGGKLIVRDMLEEYNDIDLVNYVCVDYVLYHNNPKKLAAHSIKEIENIFDLELNIFELKDDGLYTYHRMLIPKYTLYEERGKYMKDELFYKDGKFYLIIEDSPIFDELKTRLIPMQDLYIVASHLFGLEGAYDTLRSKYKVVSFENIKREFVDAQMRFSKPNVISDMTTPGIKTTGRYRRDVLLTAILLINKYLEKSLFEEADFVITQLYDSGCLLYSKRSKDCGCPN